MICGSQWFQIYANKTFHWVRAECISLGSLTSVKADTPKDVYYGVPIKRCPSTLVSVAKWFGALSDTPKSCRFIFQSGNIPRLLVQSSLGHLWVAIEQWVSVTSVFFSLSLPSSSLWNQLFFFLKGVFFVVVFFQMPSLLYRLWL